MEEENKSRFKKILSSLSYVGKLFSSAALVILVLIGLFLLYYVITAKIVSKKPGYEPPLSLYTIVSGSMEPNINVYDVIIATKVTNPTDIHVGDVITFKSTSPISKDVIVTHRVINVIKNDDGSYEYVTKGDYNPVSDSDTAKYSNIIGKVYMRLPQLGRIQFFLATKMGWFIIVLLPALGVIIYDALKLIKLISNNKASEKIKGNVNIEEINNEQINKSLNESLEKVKKDDYLKKLNELKEFEEKYKD